MKSIKDIWAKIKAFFMQVDVLLHIGACACIVLFVTAILRPFMNKWVAFGIANGVAIFAALIREALGILFPKKYSAEGKDLIADAIGIVTIDLGLVCILV